MGAFKQAGAASLHHSDQKVLIAERCIVGRARTAHWQQSSDLVSAEHAVIAHSKQGWTLRDLSSTNGSWVDGAPVVGEVRLTDNSRVSFGHKENTWVFIDSSAPHAQVKCLETGIIFNTISGYLSFPDPEQPESNLYQSEHGWILESGGQAQEAADGMRFNLPSGSYELWLPKGVSSTSSATLALEEGEQPLVLQFTVSPDEEHVATRLFYQGRSLELLHRSYSYLLLTLARKRQDDQNNPLCPTLEAGWCETRELAESFHVSPETLNLWVWRARKQVQEFHPELAPLIIERRPSLAMLRIGSSYLSITRA